MANEKSSSTSGLPGGKKLMQPGPTDWERLRNGVLLSGEFKLIERVPRWLAQRRFRAQHLETGEPVGLLFFSLPDAKFEEWQALVQKLAELKDPAIFPLREAVEFQEFRFLAGPWVEGVPLREVLESNGPLPADEIRKMIQPILTATRRMEEAEMPLPSLLPETVFYSTEEQRRARVFPLVVSDFPILPPELVPSALRDLVYELLTNISPPVRYDEEALTFLPTQIAELWKPIFVDEPVIQDFRIVIESRPKLPPSRRPRKAPSSAAVAELSGSRKDEVVASPENPAERRRPLEPAPARRPAPDFFPSDAASRRRFPVMDFLSLLVALAACGFVGWFSWQMILLLKPPPAGLPQPVVASFPTGEAALPASPRPADPEEQMAEDAADVPAQVTSEGFPADLPNRPGSALESWNQLLATHPAPAELEPDFSKYLEGLEPEIDSLRMGRLPGPLAALEKAAVANSPSARFLLGQVLWGRETQRAERLMAALAAEGHEQARAWCEERFIDW